MLAEFPPFRQPDMCSCVYCGDMLTFATVEADRIIPGSMGGTYRFENVIPACRECNASRGDRTVWSFDANVARRLKRMGRIVSAKSAA
jgi:5-methylcytosine-specific restriction endonuclease McrA